MRLLRLLLGGLGLLTLIASSAAAQFPADRDNPRRADPPVERPSTKPCTIEIVSHRFDSFAPARGRIDAARQCPGPWQRIVLELSGTVNGRQYDRIGQLQVGGVTVFRTSTPEPSGPATITWSVEKDLTEYAQLFARPQDVEMQLGNVVDKTFTGVFDVHVRVLFYPAVKARGSPSTPPPPDLVEPLTELRHDGPDTVGNMRLPANAERLLLEVYATGSGGGCEEFWYDVAPQDHRLPDYSCKGPQGPYRELQVLVDGQVAGIAAPYPHIYTGGWSNPVLWYLIPAPRTFDIQPVRFDLTPFVGKLNDGRAHDVRFRVLGVPTGTGGWAMLPNVLVWRDSASARTTGELLQTELSPLTLENVPLKEAGEASFQSRGQHRFLARGILRTSHGAVETMVEESLSSDIEHGWTSHEVHDGMRGDWTDRQRVSRRVGDGLAMIDTDLRRFGLEGAIDTAPRGGAPGVARLTTTLSIYDEGDRWHSDGARVSRWEQFSDRFDGSASYNAGVPREKREATAISRQEYLLRDSDGNRYHRVLSSRDARFINDNTNCPSLARSARVRGR